ncbi:YraN family protein [Pseudorhodoplanes sp.]|uniref:YraN family protein n=1 Tax=Pseudorhodoplanes sp. TaxID=1934341 RepID=UPI002B76077B|nr:YraN family protein [Pseudorhodoplanes sp.]HWV51371.1 YraN family protein [Pseudorhodoplanes sp.]
MAPRKPGTRSDKPSPAPERRTAFQLGLSAENLAAALLLAKGFRIAARRFRSPAGEIDIVAKRGSLLIFVEVKARALLDDAAWSVTDRQKRRIASAAAAWLAAHPEDNGCDMRFDAVLVAPRSLPKHIPGAFEAE